MGTFRLLCWHRGFSHVTMILALIVTSTTLEIYDEPPGYDQYWGDDDLRFQRAANQERKDVLLLKLLNVLQHQEDPRFRLARLEWNSESEETNAVVPEWLRNVFKRTKPHSPPRTTDHLLRLQRVYKQKPSKYVPLSQFCFLKLCPSGYKKRYEYFPKTPQ